jgi:hypothetical protein
MRNHLAIIHEKNKKLEASVNSEKNGFNGEMHVHGCAPPSHVVYF